MNNKCLTYEKSFLFHFPHVNKKESDNSYSHDSQIFTQYSFWISKLPVDRPNSFTRNNQHLIVYTHLNVLFDQKIYNSMVVELEKSLHLWDTSKMAPVSWPVTSFNFRRPPFRSIMSASSDTKRDFVSSELGTKE